MKFKTKTALVLLLTASLVIQVFTAVPAFASDKDTGYKAAYYTLIKELHKGDEWSGGYDQYKLIHLENDNIPELLAVDTPSDTFDNNGTYQYVIYTYYNGQAVKLGDYASGVASAGGYRGDTKYIRKSGKIYETYHEAASGDGNDIVYKLQDGEMKEIAHGKFNIASDAGEWNVKVISDIKYSIKLNKAFKLSKAKSLEEIETISYKAMRKKLK